MDDNSEIEVDIHHSIVMNNDERYHKTITSAHDVFVSKYTVQLLI